MPDRSNGDVSSDSYHQVNGVSCAENRMGSSLILAGVAMQRLPTSSTYVETRLSKIVHM